MLSSLPLVPAAQYLRMSTEHQQYSFHNQSLRNQKYAAEHGFQIVRTFSDAAKSGLTIKNRPALAAMLSDILAGTLEYRAVLVYDISRWGRFQDVDEAAHYEFLCRHSGIEVRYCAEPFENDGTMISHIFKSLKRTMAAEYSRELGDKVYAGQKHLVSLGFKMGALPGYGMRRCLLSGKGKQLQILRRGERKAVSTQRVILVQGPKCELDVVRYIYQLALERNKPLAITRRLNERGIRFTGNHDWQLWNVLEVLRNPKYAGKPVWGTSSQSIAKGCHRIPKGAWVNCDAKLQPVIAPTIYDDVQRILDDKRTYSDKELLDKLRRTLARWGRLSETIISHASGPSSSQYYRRFGSLRKAYERIGYEIEMSTMDAPGRRRLSAKLRDALIEKIKLVSDSSRIRVARRDNKRRPHIIVREAIRVYVHICPSRAALDGQLRWAFHPVKRESERCVTLACLLDERNNRISRLQVFPRNAKRMTLGRDGNFGGSKRLRRLVGFENAVLDADKRESL